MRRPDELAPFRHCSSHTVQRFSPASDPSECPRATSRADASRTPPAAPHSHPPERSPQAQDLLARRHPRIRLNRPRCIARVVALVPPADGCRLRRVGSRLFMAKPALPTRPLFSRAENPFYVGRCPETGAGADAVVGHRTPTDHSGPPTPQRPAGAHKRPCSMLLRCGSRRQTWGIADVVRRRKWKPVGDGASRRVSM